jgi:hypothetical protein
MAENDKVAVRATRTTNHVAIHRVHGDGHKTMVGYYSPDEAEDIGLRIIREAGKLRERIAVKAKLKSVA